MPLIENHLYSLWVVENGKNIYEGKFKGKSPSQAGHKIFKKLLRCGNYDKSTEINILFGVRDNITGKHFSYIGNSIPEFTILKFPNGVTLFKHSKITLKSKKNKS